MIRNSNAAGRSGIDVLLDFERTSRDLLPQCIAPDDATLSKYASKSKSEVAIKVWRLVLLHSGVDPDWLGDHEACICFIDRNKPYSTGRVIHQSMTPGGKLSATHKLCDNLIQARSAMRRDVMSPGSYRDGDDPLLCELSAKQFAKWADSVALPVVGPWPSRAQVAGGGDGTGDGIQLHLPCLTLKLRVMQDVAWHFFAQRADDGDGDWPRNREVLAWAMDEHDISHNMAAAIATILRPEELPRGRPPGAANGSTFSGGVE